MSQSPVVVRDATVADVPAITTIYAHHVRTSVATFELEPPSVEEMTGRVERVLASHTWLVAVDGDALLGYAYGGPFSDRPAYRWTTEVSIYLDPAGVGRGTGTQLYTSLLDRLRGRGYRVAVARIALPNAASLALHDRFGFERSGVLRDVGHKLGAWRDVALHQLALAPPVDSPAEPG